MTRLRGIRNERLRSLAEDAIGQGFRVIQTGSGHPVLASPSGERVWFSTSASDGYHVVANVRASLMRAGYIPRDRRGQKATPPVAVEDRGPAVDELHSEDEQMTQPGHAFVGEKPKVATAGGYTFASKGKSVDAADVIIGGQPFRIRYNADGSANSTTLRRSPQRSWQSRGGDLARLRASMAAFVAENGGWEPPMPDTEIPGPMNGHATDAELAEVVSAARARAVVETTARAAKAEPEPRVDEPEPAAEDDAPGGDAGGVWVSAFVDPGAYPIAKALDELDRAVGPAILALEAAGKADAAGLVRSELARTPAEAELLALYREVNNRPRLEHG
jgi:hypothetical protein